MCRASFSSFLAACEQLFWVHKRCDGALFYPDVEFSMCAHRLNSSFSTIPHCTQRLHMILISRFIYKTVYLRVIQVTMTESHLDPRCCRRAIFLLSPFVFVSAHLSLLSNPFPKPNIYFFLTLFPVPFLSIYPSLPRFYMEKHSWCSTRLQ